MQSFSEYSSSFGSSYTPMGGGLDRPMPAMQSQGNYSTGSNNRQPPQYAMQQASQPPRMAPQQQMAPQQYAPQQQQQDPYSHQQAKFVLYYSNLCEHCTELMIQFKKNPSLGQGIQKICVDDNPRLPNYIKSVPTIFIQENSQSKPYLYVGDNVFKWISKHAKQLQSQLGSPAQHPSLSNMDPSRTSTAAVSHPSMTSPGNASVATVTKGELESFNSVSTSPFGSGFGTSIGDLDNGSGMGMTLGVSDRMIENFQNKLANMPSPSGEIKYEGFPSMGSGGYGQQQQMNPGMSLPPPMMTSNSGSSSSSQDRGNMTMEQLMEQRKRDF
jgi:hypothetical protein